MSKDALAVRLYRKQGASLAALGDLPLSAALLVSPAGSRAAAIAANANYAVPAYVVGSGRLQVWLDGVLCMGGTNAAQYQYKEIGTAGASSSVIQWHQAIPTAFDILVRSH